MRSGIPYLFVGVSLFVRSTEHFIRVDMAEEGHRVILNVYDLSQGLARQLSTTFLGKGIEAIWHTGVVVYGNEYYFGRGIRHAPAGSTPYGTPIRVIDLGVTHVPKDVFETYLEEISPRYTAETYSLLTHNCNNFSNEVTQFLVGAGIPDYILQLPNEVMSSPIGALILPMIQNLETTLKAGAVPQAPQFNPASMVPPTPNVSSFSAGSLNVSKQEVEAKKIHNKAKSGQAIKLENISENASVSSGKLVEAESKSTSNEVADPLGDARNKLQEEITAEFAKIMASGTLHASQAAALATRRVMQRYGHLDSAIHPVEKHSS